MHGVHTHTGVVWTSNECVQDEIYYSMTAINVEPCWQYHYYNNIMSRPNSTVILTATSLCIVMKEQ